MNIMKKAKSYNFETLIRPLLFLMLGIILLTNPTGLVKITLYIFSFLLFLLGLFKNLLFYRQPNDRKEVITGTIYMVIALMVAGFTFFAFDMVESFIRYAFAVLFLYTAIIRIIRSFKKPWKVRNVFIISSILIIVCAVILAVLKLTINITGLVIIVYSIIEIVGFILFSKYNEESRKTPEAVILREKEELAKIE